jgi:uncharacterized membrane protein YdjX (TVP38/TMEM64 family)
MILAFSLLILASFEIYSHPNLVTSLLAKLQTWNQPTALVTFCLLFIFSNLFLLPVGLPLNLFAGLAWGTLAGGLLVNLLATFVAAISFLLARRFGHYFLNDFFNRHEFLIKLKKTIQIYDWQFVSLARINPIVPFSISNYLFGLIPELSFRHYIFATVIANLVPCFIFASIGSVLKTFSLADDSLVHTSVIKIGIVLLLISILFTIKMFTTNHQKKFTPNEEVA